MATVSKSYDYGDVIISLENCILSKEQIESTPSTRDGLDKEVEIDLRIVSCEYIQMAGILLKLPQVAMATAQVLFQRFYYSKSLIKHDAEIYAMASIFLAAKIEECPRRIRDVINVFHHIKQNRNGSSLNNAPTLPCCSKPALMGLVFPWQHWTEVVLLLLLVICLRYPKGKLGTM